MTERFMPGHLSPRGWWHPGSADGCPKCPDPDDQKD